LASDFLILAAAEEEDLERKGRERER